MKRVFSASYIHEVSGIRPAGRFLLLLIGGSSWVRSQGTWEPESAQDRFKRMLQALKERPTVFLIIYKLAEVKIVWRCRLCVCMPIGL